MAHELETFSDPGSDAKPTVGFVLDALTKMQAALPGTTKRKAKDVAVGRIGKHLKARHGNSHINENEILDTVAKWGGCQSNEDVTKYLAAEGKPGLLAINNKIDELGWDLEDQKSDLQTAVSSTKFTLKTHGSRIDRLERMCEQALTQVGLVRSDVINIAKAFKDFVEREGHQLSLADI